MELGWCKTFHLTFLSVLAKLKLPKPPDRKGVDAAPYLKKSVESRPVPQPTPLHMHTLHSKFKYLKHSACAVQLFGRQGVVERER